MAEYESLLGMVLYPSGQAGQADGLPRPALVIGHVHDESESQIVEFADDLSTAVLDRATGATYPLNRDRASTEQFLQAFDEYIRSGPADAPPMTLTAEQAQNLIARFQAGKITPPKPRPRPVPHRTRVKTLRHRLHEIDPDALGVEHWWRTPLEEAENGLI
ncbi:hypothetical protein E1193_00375 [Micromonospora sp. KC606]|uniref:SUKH-4 family immunity protein n=1 Tax=Micromonospora sp. KC606 TaxID=2530379 RepID=UPI0010465625|nr:SUKH-4 family immunity protein [Micromonospora sp. KC606]TDC86158.1 hypothetical protein E1193_00375 [Micromonospora sp. KC606]